jgi:hypothetical protein
MAQMDYVILDQKHDTDLQPLPRDGQITVTNEDINAAREALVQAHYTCGMFPRMNGKHGCDCDLSSITGCKAKVTRIALAIAKARAA